MGTKKIKNKRRVIMTIQTSRSINKLPNDILAEILAWTGDSEAIDRTCKRWRNLAPSISIHLPNGFIANKHLFEFLVKGWCFQSLGRTVYLNQNQLQIVCDKIQTEFNLVNNKADSSFSCVKDFLKGAESIFGSSSKSHQFNLESRLRIQAKESFQAFATTGGL
jgi:hypothetical protein